MVARRSENGFVGQRLFSRLSNLQDEMYGKNRTAQSLLGSNKYRPLQPAKTPFRVRAPKAKAKASVSTHAPSNVISPAGPGAIPKGSSRAMTGMPVEISSSSSVPKLTRGDALTRVRDVVDAPAKAPSLRRNLRPTVGSIWGVRERQNQS